MRILITALTFILASLGVCQAQEIEMEKVFGGYKFIQNGQELNMGELVSTMETHEQAFELIKKAQSQNSLTSVIGFVGGGLIGWPLGTAVGGGDPNWALAGVGLGLIAINIPIQSSMNKNARQAVELHNQSFNSTSFHERKPEFRIALNRTGFGISMSF